MERKRSDWKKHYEVMWDDWKISGVDFNQDFSIDRTINDLTTEYLDDLPNEYEKIGLVTTLLIADSTFSEIQDILKVGARLI